MSIEPEETGLLEAGEYRGEKRATVTVEKMDVREARESSLNPTVKGLIDFDGEEPVKMTPLGVDHVP